MHTSPSLRPWRLCLLLSLATGIAWAEASPAAYPRHAVTLVVPTAPSGGTDTIARWFAQALGQFFQQSFVVQNLPGANGILGLSAVAKAPADGYRLLFTYAAAMVVNPSLYPQLPYAPLRDFVPIAQVARGGNLLLVKKDVPAQTLAQWVRYVQAHPQALSYCSWGHGSGGHLTMEYLQRQAGLSMVHVPYQGSAACVQALLAGQLDAGFADISSTEALVHAGKVKALAHSGSTRLPGLPDVPSLTEAGYPFTQHAWYGLFAPAGTPHAIVEQLNSAMRQALQDPAMVQRLHDANLTDLPQLTPAQFAETVRSDIQAWDEIIQASQVRSQAVP